MPSKQFYLNDIMAIISCGWSFAHVIFWVIFIGRLTTTDVLNAMKPSKITENSEKILNRLTSRSAVQVPFIFWIMSVLFYLLAALLDYQSYTTNGSTFYFGLTDVNNPNRQWYYALGMALLALTTVLLPTLTMMYVDKLKEKLT